MRNQSHPNNQPSTLVKSKEKENKITLIFKNSNSTSKVRRKQKLDWPLNVPKLKLFTE